MEIDLDPAELLIISNALLELTALTRETPPTPIRTDWQFETRVGGTVEDARALRERISEALRASRPSD